MSATDGTKILSTMRVFLIPALLRATTQAHQRESLEEAD
jgi:hypothetical protein